MTNIVYNYILPTGLIVPDTADILTEVQSEYTNAFGTALNVTSPSTPQGLLINAETQARVSVATNNATLANQINPNYAGGIFLDAILGLMGAQRTPATTSLLSCTLTGVVGTVIPAGSLAQDASGNQWQCLNNVVIPTGGTLTSVSFDAIETGPISIAANQLTTIVSNILGWETITNPAGSTSPGNIIGQNTQSDVQARQYRINSLYLQSNGLAGSIISALYATTGVSSLSFLENPSTATTIKGVAMAANSIYVCVNGGTDLNIAATLTATKSAGCAYTNGASQTSITTNGTLASNENVTSISSTVGINVGMAVSGTGIVTGTVVTGIINSTSLTISIPATVSSVESLTYNNNITIPYTVPISGQVIDVLFDRPDLIRIGVQITVLLNSAIQDYINTISQAILNYAQGLVNGLAGLGVGDEVSPFEIAAAVAIQFPGVYVVNCEISNLTPVVMNGTLHTTTTITGLVNALEVLYVGMSVTGTDIPLSTFIQSITNDTTIVITNAATGSTTTSLTFTGVFEAVTIDIEPWQLATIALSDITVSLA